MNMCERFVACNCVLLVFLRATLSGATDFHCKMKSGCIHSTQCDPIPKEWSEAEYNIEKHLFNKEFPITCSIDELNKLGIEFQKDIKSVKLENGKLKYEIKDLGKIQEKEISALKSENKNLEKSLNKMQQKLNQETAAWERRTKNLEKSLKNVQQKLNQEIGHLKTEGENLRKSFNEVQKKLKGESGSVKTKKEQKESSKQVQEKLVRVSWNTFTPCSQTCGGGHRYKVERCSENDIKKCRKTYEECNTHECLSYDSCPKNYELMYGRESSCCAKRTQSCGIPSITTKDQNLFKSRRAVVGQWPWAAALVMRRAQDRYCSGLLIHKDWVLASGVCISNIWFKKEENFYVLLGSTSIKKSESSKQNIEIENLILHEDYVEPSNNIGLVQLKKSAILNDYVKPICLPNGQKVKSDAICVSAGWGADPKGHYSGGNLFYAAQRNLPGDACVDEMADISWKIELYSEEQNLCFGDLSGRACVGGYLSSAVICQSCASCGWYFASVVLYGKPASDENCGSPEVHTNVEKYEDWIKQKISKGLPSQDTNLCKELPVSVSYTRCSKSCDGGYHIRETPCLYNRSSTCKTYEECNTFNCPTLESCPALQEFRFESRSSCCTPKADTCGNSYEVNDISHRIIGEVKSPVRQWPWMAVLVNRTHRLAHCSGSLIHKDWVLTAAHCISVYYKESDYYVLLGSNTIKLPESGNQIIEIEKFVAHDIYYGQKRDIGLVKLKTSAKFNDFVKPICLPNGEAVKLDTTCIAAGWGIASKEDIKKQITSDSLQHVALRHLPGEACTIGLWRSPTSPYYNAQQNLCFGILSGSKDTCNGDSGGPLMCQRCSSCGWYVAGITSYGAKNCGEKGKPAVYVNVKHLEYWIRKKVKGLPSKSYSC